MKKTTQTKLIKGLIALLGFSCLSITTGGSSILAAQENSIPLNLTIVSTPINVTLPSSIDLSFNGTNVNAIVADNFRITNNGKAGNIKVTNVAAKIKDSTWTLNSDPSDKTYENLPLDSKQLYVEFSSGSTSTALTPSGIDPNIKIGPDGSGTNVQEFSLTANTGGSSSQISSTISDLVFTLEGDRADSNTLSITATQTGDYGTAFKKYNDAYYYVVYPDHDALNGEAIPSSKGIATNRPPREFSLNLRFEVSQPGIVSFDFGYPNQFIVGTVNYTPKHTFTLTKDGNTIANNLDSNTGRKELSLSEAGTYVLKYEGQLGFSGDESKDDASLYINTLEDTLYLKNFNFAPQVKQMEEVPFVATSDLRDNTGDQAPRWKVTADKSTYFLSGYGFEGFEGTDLPSKYSVRAADPGGFNSYMYIDFTLTAPGTIEFFCNEYRDNVAF